MFIKNKWLVINRIKQISQCIAKIIADNNKQMEEKKCINAL